MNPIPADIVEAVQKGTMPLLVYADWLEDHGYSAAADEARTIAKRQAAGLSALSPDDEEFQAVKRVALRHGWTPEQAMWLFNDGDMSPEAMRDLERHFIDEEIDFEDEMKLARERLMTKLAAQRVAVTGDEV